MPLGKVHPFIIQNSVTSCQMNLKSIISPGEQEKIIQD